MDIMINWSTPDTDIVKACAETGGKSRRLGSDTAPANIYLLSRKYDIKTAVAGNALLRYYNGSKPNRRGYGFPLFCGTADITALIGLMKRDADERGVPFEFCLCDERQRAVLDTVCVTDWNCTDDDSDYIYKTESLAALSGKKLHRKRNHVNSFHKLYDDVEYRALGAENAADALTVAEKWLTERDGASDDERAELESIRSALNNMDALGIFGGVLYAEGIPVAMTAASVISGAAVDVHYEKAFGEYAVNGAFTVINQCFASSVDCEYINREEDMGIAGLRTAKESYYPAFKLKKYYGVCRC